MHADLHYYLAGSDVPASGLQAVLGTGFFHYMTKLISAMADTPDSTKDNPTTSTEVNEMTYAEGRRAAQAYGVTAVHSGVEAATPHRLVQMLMEGALEKIALAHGQMQHGKIAEKGENISWAISIIEGMRISLDLEAGGEIARNLNDLYDYMGRRLLEANLRNDLKAIEEVAGLLREIKAGWDAIPALLGQP